VEFPDSSGTLKCLGAGVRVKKVAILNVNVYAMALYAEPAGLKAAGGELLDGAFDKAMCLTLARDVRACSSLLSPTRPHSPAMVCVWCVFCYVTAGGWRMPWAEGLARDSSWAPVAHTPLLRCAAPLYMHP
jgi:hypothetical protein